VLPAYMMLLHPANPACAVEPERLADTLQGLGLIGAPRPLGERVFYPTGAEFLQLVTFLGCSPAIELDPPADPARLAQASAAGRFCHAFITRTPQPRLRADAATPAPRCPTCKQPLPDWPATLMRWRLQLPAAPWQCSGCRQDTDIMSLRFRKTAGIARIWLDIRGIHPFEAVPAPALLDGLRALTGTDWLTCYLQE